MSDREVRGWQVGQWVPENSTTPFPLRHALLLDGTWEKRASGTVCKPKPLLQQRLHLRAQVLQLEARLKFKQTNSNTLNVWLTKTNEWGVSWPVSHFCFSFLLEYTFSALKIGELQALVCCRVPVLVPVAGPRQWRQSLGLSLSLPFGANTPDRWQLRLVEWGAIYTGGQ